MTPHAGLVDNHAPPLHPTTCRPHSSRRRICSAPSSRRGDEGLRRASRPRSFTSGAGDLLNPARLDAETAAELKASLPSHVWAGQYQQRPIAGARECCRSTSLVGSTWPSRRSLRPSSIRGLGATVSGNASVCTEWGLAKNQAAVDSLYLTRVVRVRLQLPEVRAMIQAEDKRIKPSLIIIDERGVGLGLVQDLKRAGLRNVTSSTATSSSFDLGSNATRPSDSKIERFGKAALWIASGTVLIPEKAPWLDEFLYEVAAFPNISDNDQVDAMTQVVANFERAVRLARLNKDRFAR